MTSNRFFVQKNDIDFPHVSLSGNEHHHLSRVARIKVHSLVWLFDEEGTSYRARVDRIGHSHTSLSILERIPKPVSSRQILVAQSLLKSKAQELILQKGTELGMTDFLPLISERSIIKLKTDLEKKIGRWEKIIREAAKQCGRSHIPRLMLPLTLSQFLQKPTHAQKIFLYEKGGLLLRDKVLDSFQSPKIKSKDASLSINLLIGPEGGWTNQEAQDILENGYEAISLGGNALRSETAALSALAILSHFGME